MSQAKTALILVGSPKGKGSASDSLGSALIDRLKVHGAACEKLYIYSSVATPQGREALLQATARADTVVFSYPLYIDSIPAGLIDAMEMMAKQRSGQGKKRLAVIVQSGFPEASQNEISIAICKAFAKDAGFIWAGGLGIGEGPVISRINFSSSNGMGGGLKRALDSMAEALARGEQVPQEAVRLAAKPAFAIFLYKFMATRGWKGQAKENKAKIEARPLVESR